MEWKWDLILNTQIISTLFTTLFGGGLLGAYITYRLQNKRTRQDIIRENKQKQLDNVYEPIRSIITSNDHPDEGYSGLGDMQVNQIEAILKNNAIYIDVKLNWLVNRLIQEQYYAHQMDIKFPEYDGYDKGYSFAGYIGKKYNQLRKDLHLPYNHKHFFPYSLIFSDSAYKFNWKIKRIIRKIRKKSNNTD
ncbi:MAG TPA: hypothetical protein VGE40_01185 [Bacilli bacterium]